MPDTRFVEKRFARDPSFVSRRILDEVLLVPIRRRAGDVDKIFTLNPVAARVWELLDGEHSVAQVGAAIVEEFEVGPEEATKDAVELLQQLECLGAVREA